MMPWPTKKLGEVCDFEGGTQPPKSVFKYEPQKGYIRLLQIRDFISDDKATYIPDSPKFRKCASDDVLIGRYGASVGKILRGKTGAYNVAIIKTIPDQNVLSKNYLFMFLQSPEVQASFTNFTKRAAQAGFTKEEIGSFKIPLPPLEEQKKIVAKIEKLFAKIDETSRLRAEALSASAALLPAALYQVFSRAEKEGWEQKVLGEICDILDSQRKPVTKGDRKPGPYPYYGATGVQDYVADYIFDEPLVLVGEDGAKWGPGEETAYRVEGKCWVNNHAHVLRPHRDRVLDGWLACFLNISDLSEHISGLTVKKLNQAKLRSIKIPLPPIAEQKKIVAYLDALSDKAREVQSLQEATAAELNTLRQSILAHELASCQK